MNKYILVAAFILAIFSAYSNVWSYDACCLEKACASIKTSCCFGGKCVCKSQCCSESGCKCAGNKCSTKCNC